MFALRVVGGLFALALVVVPFIRHRQRKISRLSLLISWALAVGLGLLAASPTVFNPLFNLFNFQAGGGRRLLGVLFFAVMVIIVLLLRVQSLTDENQRSIRLLVESLAVSSFDWEQAKGLPQGDRILVLMPAYNEAENVGAVIRAMPERVEGLPVGVIVIDDDSDDDTARVAREAGAMVVRNPIRRGGGLALRVGYEIAVRLGAVVVVTMDADGQHVPDEMHLLVKPILAGEADMIQGSRMLGDFEKESHVRHLGVLFFSRLVTLITGNRVTDVSSGYRATRADLLADLVLEQDQFWTSELLIEGLRHRANVKEVPITILARAGGESKKPKNLRYGWNFTRAIIKTWLR